MLKETLEYKVGFPGLLSAFQKLVSHPSPGRWEQCTAALLPWKVPLDDELDWGSVDWEPALCPQVSAIFD